MRNSEILKPRSEADEQAAVMEWLRISFPEVPVFVSCQGIKLHIITAMRLKRLGYQTGSADFLFLKCCNGFPGLVVEMKRRKGGVVSPEQTEWLGKCAKQGYKVVICRGSDEAIREIKGYTGNK